MPSLARKSANPFFCHPQVLKADDPPLGGRWPWFFRTCHEELAEPLVFTQKVKYRHPLQRKMDPENGPAGLLDGAECNMKFDDLANHVIDPNDPEAWKQLLKRGDWKEELKCGFKPGETAAVKRFPHGVKEKSSLVGSMMASALGDSGEDAKCVPGQQLIEEYDDPVSGKTGEKYVKEECKIRAVVTEGERMYVGFCEGNPGAGSGTGAGSGGARSGAEQDNVWNPRNFELRVTNGAAEHEVGKMLLSVYGGKNLAASYDFLGSGVKPAELREAMSFL